MTQTFGLSSPDRARAAQKAPVAAAGFAAGPAGASAAFAGSGEKLPAMNAGKDCLAHAAACRVGPAAAITGASDQ
jgi:hypothetical protein